MGPEENNNEMKGVMLILDTFGTYLFIGTEKDNQMHLHQGMKCNCIEDLFQMVTNTAMIDEMNRPEQAQGKWLAIILGAINGLRLPEEDKIALADHLDRVFKKKTGPIQS